MKLIKLNLIFVALTLLVIVQNAWVSDDAYITFRTIDNWFNGFGLVWNVGQRVQAFTHPLWMFVISFFHLFIPNMYYASLVVSLLCCAAVLWVFSFRIARTSPKIVIGLLILIFSKAFIDYSTSGLENALTHLLVVVFACVYFRQDGPSSHRLFWLSLTTGLAMCNRMDTLVLLLPAMVYEVVAARSFKHALVFFAGILPFFAWEIFSLFYYGFPFPNTAYAKLNTGIASADLMRQGFVYLFDCLRRDPLTLAVILLGICIPAVTRKWKSALLSLGILFYLIYIIKIGGDFMAGRFFSAPLLMSVCVVVKELNFGMIRRSAAAAAAIMIVGFCSPYPPILTAPTNGTDAMALIESSGIADERRFYFDWNGLINLFHFEQMPAMGAVSTGMKLRENPGTTVHVMQCVGISPFYAGSKNHIVDAFALTDPFLARLEAFYKDGGWRIGHFCRQLPQGYVSSIRSNENFISDEKLAAFYDKLNFVISGPLWSRERLLEIVNFNLGRYNDLLPQSKARHPREVDYKDVETDVQITPGTVQRRSHTIPRDGLIIRLPSRIYSKTFQLILSGGENLYSVDLLDGEYQVYQTSMEPRPGFAYMVWTVKMVNSRRGGGYDRIQIIPIYSSGEPVFAGIHFD